MKNDREIIESWIKEDSIHTKNGITYEDIIEPGTEAIVICDDDNSPIMVIRLHQALRVAIQFNPRTPYKTAKVAPKILEWLTQVSLNRGCKEIIIRPGGKAVAFSEKLGFKDFIGKILRIF